MLKSGTTNIASGKFSGVSINCWNIQVSDFIEPIIVHSIDNENSSIEEALAFSRMDFDGVDFGMGDSDGDDVDGDDGRVD